MSKIKRVPVNIFDNQRKSFDDIAYINGKGTNSFTNEHNMVEIEVKNKKTGQTEDIIKSNLITYRGRAWLAQRAFNLNLGAPSNNRSNNDSTSVVTPGYASKYISMVGVGYDSSGGSCALDPTDVYESDYELAGHGTVWSAGNSVNSGNFWYRQTNSPATYRQYHRIDSSYPVFLDDWNVSGGGTNSGYVKDPRYDSYMENVLYNTYKIDSYLKALVRVTITPVECNGPKFYNESSAGEYYQDINEFGLFVAPYHSSDDATYLTYRTANPSTATYNWKKYRPELFARVTCPTIRKDESIELVINWYAFF
jgi:hypothetical protein